MNDTSLFKTLLSLAASVALVSTSSAAFKPEGAIEHTVKDANVGESCFKSGAHWGDGTGGIPDENHDYYSNGSGKQVVMDGTFPGRSLWLEGWDCAKNGSGTAVVISDLHLYNARFVYYSFPRSFDGSITVHGGATSQFPLGASSNSPFNFGASLSNDGDNAIFKMAQDSVRPYKYTVPATGSWSGWNGEFQVGTNVTLVLKNAGCPGSISVLLGGRFIAQPTGDMTIGAVTNTARAFSVAFDAPAGGTVSVGDFRANDVTVVTNTASGLSCGLFKVTSSYTPGPNPLKVVVGGQLACAQDTVYDALKLPLVRFAPGVFDGATLADFDVSYTHMWDNYASYVEFVVETDEDLSRTLYLKRKRIVIHTTQGGTTDTAENWTPAGAATDPDSMYVVLRSTARPNNSVAFASALYPSLVQFAGGRIVFGLVANQKYEYRMQDMFVTGEFSDLCFEGGVEWWHGWLGNSSLFDMTIRGGYLTLYPRNTKEVRFVTYANHTTHIESEIRGTCALNLETRADGTKVVPVSFYDIKGTNTNYSGKLLVSTWNNAVENESYVAPTESHCTTVYVRDGRNLGGAMPSVTKDGITLARMSVVETRASSVVFDEPTRGIKASGVGRLRAREGEVMEIRSPLTYDGALWKEGAGTLVLAGAPYFGDGSTRTPSAGSNVLLVKAGALKPLTADALAGVDVTFLQGTSLRLPAGTANADLAAHGVVMTNALSSLAVDGGGRLTVAFDGVAADASKFSAGVASFSTRADAEAAMASMKAKRLESGLRGVLSVTEADGLFTVTATYVRGGFILVFR